MRETMLSPGERRFLALAAAAAVCIVSLAFWYAVPPSPAQASSAVVEPLRESFRVDLNTAGVDAMTTLPGLGEKKAREPFWNIVLPMADSRASMRWHRCRVLRRI